MSNSRHISCTHIKILLLLLVYAHASNDSSDSQSGHIPCPVCTNQPTEQPITSIPTINPITSIPTMNPITSIPTMNPITSIPTMSPITSIPTGVPTMNPLVCDNPGFTGVCDDDEKTLTIGPGEITKYCFTIGSDVMVLSDVSDERLYFILKLPNSEEIFTLSGPTTFESQYVYYTGSSDEDVEFTVRNEGMNELMFKVGCWTI
eukprot:219603_1